MVMVMMIVVVWWWWWWWGGRGGGDDSEDGGDDGLDVAFQDFVSRQVLQSFLSQFGRSSVHWLCLYVMVKFGSFLIPNFLFLFDHLQQDTKGDYQKALLYLCGGDD